MRNAIPREAYAVITVPTAIVEEFQKTVSWFSATIVAELAGVESGLGFTVAPVECPATVMTHESQDKFLNMMYAIPNGAIRMIADKPEVVETSTNLSIVWSDDKQVEIVCLLRSSVDSAKKDLVSAMVAACELAGASPKTNGEYPGWKPNFDSAILKTMKDVYQKLYGKTPEVKVIHAGLECAVFGKNYPDMDYISFGPTIQHPHSPGEKVNIPSVAKFWDYLVETLKTI
jgi:dipeptidase D